MYHLDLVARLPEENALIIRGWAFNKDTGLPAQISVEANEPVQDVRVLSKYREDVLKYYGLKNGADVGFLMKIRLGALKGNVRLNIKNGAGDGADEQVLLNLDRRKCDAAELDVKKEVRQRFAHNLKQYLHSGNGARLLINKIKKEMPGIDPTYAAWIGRHEQPESPEDIQKTLETLHDKPTISLLVPVYNVGLKWFEKMVDSVRNQTYPYWQLCIADDCSSDPALKAAIQKLEAEDPRIKAVFREKNGHISRATNSALALADGEFIGLLDNDDALAPNALLEVVRYLNAHPDTDMVYSDEDKIDENDIRKDPYFKSDFAPDTLMGNNYICHFTVLRKSLFDHQAFMRPEYDGAQDHDLFLRVAEQARHIGHIPKILYHWRSLPTSTAQSVDAKDYSADAGVRAVEDALRRRGLCGSVSPTAYGGFYSLDYAVTESKKVSVIIPTKDNPHDIRVCVDSIVAKTEYPNYEILVVDNGSVRPESKQAFTALEQKYPDKVRVIPMPMPFNYSRINNRAAEQARGTYLLFLNDDTQVLTRGWMTRMVGYAQQPWIGCVGAKLYYPDHTIQHAGVVMGILGIAGHVFTHYPENVPGYFGRLIIPVDYTAVTAACLMVARDKFWQVGGFDENIAVAFNDVDLCCKIADAGYYNVFLPKVELFHYESKSRGYETTPDKMIRFDGEKGKIVKKWRRYIHRDPMYNPNLTLVRGDYSINV